MTLSPQICVCLVLGAAWSARGADHDRQPPPLHARIDAAIESAHFGSPADVASDAEFHRRIRLDLIGRSPTIEETRSFLTDNTPNKRAALIDTLLASEEFNHFFATVLDVMLMERRGGVRIEQDAWRKFLHNALTEKRSFDQIVRSIIMADGTGEFRGAAKFLLERQVEPNALTRDVGRIFLGRDLQCAQCHDHPIIDDYLQSEYYGILAFLNRSYLFEDAADNKKSYVGERAEGGTEFKSVFMPDDDISKTIPRLLVDLSLDVEPRLDGEDAYVVTPTNKTAGVPKFSRRAQLARLMTHPSNENFSKNVANRFWAHMMGRGIVDPVDFQHSDNPPSHPSLLKTLSSELVTMRFDIREFIRQIALSDTYQRSVDFPDSSTVALRDLESAQEQLQAKLSKLEATSVDDRAWQEFQARLQRNRKLLSQHDQSISDSAKRLGELDKQQADLSKSRQNTEQQLAAKQSQLTALNNLVDAARKATEALPKDKALANTLSKYQNRVEELNKEIESTKNKIAEKKKQFDAVDGTLVSERHRLARLKAERVGLADMVAESRGALGVFRARQQSRASALNELRQQFAALDVHREYLVQRQTHQELSAQHAKLAAVWKVADRELKDLQSALADEEQRIAAGLESLAAFSEVTTSTVDALSNKSTALDELKTAIAQARIVAEQLADPQLEADVNALAEKQAKLATELTAEKEKAEQHDAERNAAQAEFDKLTLDRESLVAKHAKSLARATQRETELAAAKKARDSASAAAELASDALRKSWERRFAVRSLNPLSPEQFAGSTVAALGLDARFQHEAESEWQKNNQDKKPAEFDKTKKRADVEALVQKRVRQVESTFVSLFAAPAGAPQDVFSATADQALFFANDGRVQGWLTPSAGSLIKRLQAIEEADDLASELHLAILSRPATDTEKLQVTKYLAQRNDDRSKAIRELAWGLLSSLEFRFNH